MAFKCADQLGAGHFRHDDVADDEVEFLLLEQLDGFGAARAGDRLVIEVLERIDRRRADPGIILDQQDARAGHMRFALGALDRRVQPHRRRGGFGARQIDRHRGPLAELAFDADFAARLVREAEDLAQSQPGALADRLGGEERLERPLEHLGGHAAAGVADADPDIFARTDVADLVGLAASRSRC